MEKWNSVVFHWLARGSGLFKRGTWVVQNRMRWGNCSGSLHRMYLQGAVAGWAVPLLTDFKGTILAEQCAGLCTDMWLTKMMSSPGKNSGTIEMIFLSGAGPLRFSLWDAVRFGSGRSEQQWGMECVWLATFVGRTEDVVFDWLEDREYVFLQIFQLKLQLLQRWYCYPWARIYHPPRRSESHKNIWNQIHMEVKNPDKK